MLVEFHTAHKLTLMAHSPSHYREMGPLVAQASTLPWQGLTAQYGTLLMARMTEIATPGRHCNVLQHLAGYLKRDLDPSDRAEMAGVIEDYRHEMVPLIVPLTLLNHHFRRLLVPDWIHQQVYLNPYPKELMLRNHA